MDRIKRARTIFAQIQATRKATRSLIRVDELTDEELNAMINLYDPYEVNYNYEVGHIFNYNDQLYEVIQAHTSLANWIPSELPALYLRMMPDNVIPEWVQPLGQHDAYPLNAIVIYEGKEWISQAENNVWKPGEYGWILNNE